MSYNVLGRERDHPHLHGQQDRAEPKEYARQARAVSVGEHELTGPTGDERNPNEKKR